MDSDSVQTNVEAPGDVLALTPLDGAMICDFWEAESVQPPPPSPLKWDSPFIRVRLAPATSRVSADHKDAIWTWLPEEEQFVGRKLTIHDGPTAGQWMIVKMEAVPAERFTVAFVKAAERQELMLLPGSEMEQEEIQ